MGILNLIFGSFTTKLEGIFSMSMLSVMQQLINKSRKALLIVISSLVFALLFTAGVILTIVEASAQYDMRGVIFFSAMLTTASLLTLISLGALVLILWPRSRAIIPAASFQASQPPPRHSPLEDSLAMVINELVKYVQEKNKPDDNADSRSTKSKYDPNTPS